MMDLVAVLGVESMNRVHAVDIRTREKLWMYDPRVAEETGTDLRVGWEHNRGIGLWKDKVYLATWDGRLIAVNRETGKEVWNVRTFDAGGNDSTGAVANAVIDIINVNRLPIPNAKNGRGKNIRYGLSGSKHHQNIT